MRLSRANLTAVTAARPDSGRPVIAAVKFEREASISADGFRLTVVPYPDGPADEDDPAIGLLVPIEAVTRAAAVVAAGMPIGGLDDDEPIGRATLTEDVISLAKVGERFVLTITGAENPRTVTTITGVPVAGKFPDWRKIVPADTDLRFDVAVQPSYLRAALDAVAPDGTVAVRLRMVGPDAQVRVDAVGHPHESNAYVVVMPMSMRGVGAGLAAGESA